MKFLPQSKVFLGFSLHLEIDTHYQRWCQKLIFFVYEVQAWSFLLLQKNYLISTTNKNIFQAVDNPFKEN